MCSIISTGVKSAFLTVWGFRVSAVVDSLSWLQSRFQFLFIVDALQLTSYLVLLQPVNLC